MIVFTIIFLPPNSKLVFDAGQSTLTAGCSGYDAFRFTASEHDLQSHFYIILGLLTFLSGFELLYAALELSLLLEALFAGINLGLALVGLISWSKMRRSSSHEHANMDCHSHWLCRLLGTLA